MLPGVVCLEEEQELKASATSRGDEGEKFLLHELCSCSLQASASADRAKCCFFALPSMKIQPRELFSSLHLPCQQELFAQVQGQSSGADVGGAEEAPKVGGCFWKSENVEHVVWGHWSMNTEPFTAFTAEGTCRTELADVLHLMGISDMGEPNSSSLLLSISRYTIL